MDASADAGVQEAPAVGAASPKPAHGPKATCPCGNVYMEDSAFCRRCGLKRAVEGDELHDDGQRSVADISLVHAFGVFPEKIRGAVHSLGDDACAFVVGRRIGIWDFSRKRLNFLDRSETNAALTALAKSANGRLLAIAEQFSPSDEGRPDGALVHITIVGLPAVYAAPAVKDVKEKVVKEGTLKVIKLPKKHGRIVDLAFTPDGRHVVSVSAMPETTITYWRWEIEKAISSHDVQLPITRLQVNPKNGHEISASGPGYMRVWELNPNDHNLHDHPVFSLNQEKQARVVDHCWVHEEAFLCVAVADGHVHLFQDGECRQDIDVRAIIAKDESTGPKAIEREQAKALAKLMGSESPNRVADPPPVMLMSLATWGHGFVVGGDQGYLGIFKVDAKCSVEPFGTFRMPGEQATLWAMSADSEDAHLSILSYTETEPPMEPSRTSTSFNKGMKRNTTPAWGRNTSRISTANFTEALDDDAPERAWSLTDFPVSQADLAGTGQLELFRPVVPMGVHSGPIFCMATCPTRRVVATCGNDMQLKLWSYPTSDMVDLPLAFNSEMSIKVSTYEKPSRCAMHPLGFQIAVILEDMLRIFHLTMPQAERTLFDLPLKHPGDVAYSNSGDLLAVTSNSDVILVDPWKGVLVRIFSGAGGHLSFVNQVSFSDDDKVLLSCSAAPSGAIYGWSMWSDAKERIFEHVAKGTDYSGFQYDFDRELVVATTRPEGNIRMTGTMNANLIDLPADSASFKYTTLALAAHLGFLFAGMQQGSVRILTWPLRSGGAGRNALKQVSLHAHPVTALALSSNGHLLFSTCRGGAMMASSIGGTLVHDENRIALTDFVRDKYYNLFRRRELNHKKRNRDDARKSSDLQKKLTEAIGGLSANAATLDDMVLLPKSYLSELMGEIRSLEERMATLKHESEFAMEQKEAQSQEKIDQMFYERQIERQQHDEKYESLFDQYKKALSRHSEEMNAQSSDFETRARQRQDEFENKIALEYEKQSRLLNELQSLKEAHVQDVAKQTDKHGQQLQSLREANESAIREWRADYDKVCALLKSDSLKFEEALRQQETEYEEQISEILELKRAVLQVESEKSTTALKDGVSMKQTITMLQGNIVDLKGKLEESDKQRQELHKQLEASKEMFANVQEQLKEEKRALKVKGESLAKIREQMKHLESFRFVLFHKVKQMEEERDPLAEQVNSLKSSVREMYGEFVREFRHKQSLDQQLIGKTHLTSSLQQENIVLERKLIQLKKDARRLLNDVEQVLHAETAAEFERMPKRLRDVLEKHQKLSQWEAAEEEGGDQQKDATKEQMMVNEMVIQRDLLFKKNQMATNTAIQTKRECGTDLRRLTSENAALINELNTLRTENRSLLRKCKELEASIISLRSTGMAPRKGDSPGGAANRGGAGPGPGAGGAAGGGGGGGGAGETPYVRRKVVDQQEAYRRMRQRQMNQLPPVQSPPASAAAADLSGGSGGRQMRFSQSMDSLSAAARRPTDVAAGSAEA